MIRYCANCGQLIKPGEGYDEIIPDSLSGARPTEYLHKRQCGRPQPKPIPE
jgi:hypothetical protein